MISPTSLIRVTREDLAILVVSGPDRTDYLHRLSTQNFKILQSDDVVPGAFLSGSGSTISLFIAC